MKTLYKIFILIGVSLVGILAIVIFLILPYQKKILADQANIINARNDITAQQEKSQKILQNSQELKNLDQGEITSIFIEKNKALNFISLIEKIAGEKNCELTIKLSEPTEEDYSELNLQLTATGDWKNILNFITELEKQDFYINYQNIQILPATTLSAEDDVNYNKITANISAITYWL